jgi:hypothetical protein
LDIILKLHINVRSIEKEFRGVPKIHQDSTFGCFILESLKKC